MDLHGLHDQEKKTPSMSIKRIASVTVDTQGSSCAEMFYNRICDDKRLECEAIEAII